MDKPEKRIDLNSELGMSRRDLIRRGAIVGGTLLWVAPAIQSFAPKAFAVEGDVGSKGCAACYCWDGVQGAIHHPETGEAGTNLQQDGLRSSSDCEDWCLHKNKYATSGGAPKPPGNGPYEHSQYCNGATNCQARTSSTQTGVDHHEAHCD
jgi:hypothetical protein